MLQKAVHVFFAVSILILSSCSKMGYGILLWSTEDPPILSGTVLPVYIQSNIDQVWVVGTPDDSMKFEIPLAQFEFSGSRKKALERAAEFSQYALVYAENLQDGLPVRDNPDNSSRRVYRLRPGEIIKILEKVEGNPPISTSGDPLPGDWYLVLTEEGVTGYCFSYRLRMFDHIEGPLQATPVLARETAPDPDLDLVFSRRWSPEYYQTMLNSRRVNVAELEKQYRFDPGQDTGIAKITHPELEREFIYESIIPDGERSWRFEGTNLQMTLRTNTTLAVQYLDDAGTRRTLLFVALSSDVNDLILQEYARRDAQFLAIYNAGPVFTSNNYGTIAFTDTGEFTWTGFDLLTGDVIPADSFGRGTAYMDLFIVPSLAERFSGAVTLRLTDVTPNRNIVFLYAIDNQGLRLEVVPDFGIEDVTVTRRAPSPMVLYFYRDTDEYSNLSP